MTAEEKVREVELALDGVDLREIVRGSIINHWYQFKTPWHWCSSCERECDFDFLKLYELQELFGEAGLHAVFVEETERLSEEVLAFDPAHVPSASQWNLFLRWRHLNVGQPGQGVVIGREQEAVWREVEDQRRKMFPEPEKMETAHDR